MHRSSHPPHPRPSPTTLSPPPAHKSQLQTEVKETAHAVRGTHERSGRKMVNQYIIMEQIGKGMHGTVRRGLDSTNGDYVVSPASNHATTTGYIDVLIQAIKIVERVPKHKKLGLNSKPFAGRPHARAGPGAVTQAMRTTEDKIRREIAIMKKCHHPHVVQLREVIDDPHNKRIFLGEQSTFECLFHPPASTTPIELFHRLMY
jgi:SNF1-activating kinase 1